jgi:eukaryotic-like serine/threonine-protein kinase
MEPTAEGSEEIQAILGGKYKVAKVLGRGGMGVVVEAQNVATKGLVAIKIIQRVEADGGVEVMKRFEREVRAAGGVDSPHVVRVFDTGVVDGGTLPYLVMERLRGDDLAGLVRRTGPLEPMSALRVVAQMLRGLVAVHASGIVHRDIKPGNVFLADVGMNEITVKLLDFGVAKLTVDTLTDGDAALSRTGALLGSPEYMSPEQAMGDRTIDARTDVWSTGVVLFKMLTGESPHAGLSLAQTLMAVCQKPPVPVQESAPWVPRTVAAIVKKATCMDRDERYQSAQEMLEAVMTVLGPAYDLRPELLQGLSAETRARHSVRAPSALTLPTLAGVAEDASRTKTGLSRNALLGGLVASLAVVGIGAALMRRPAPIVVPTQGTGSAVAVTQGAIDNEVLVKVTPAGAEVMVDGKLAPVIGGFVRVNGALASEHVLVVSHQGRSSEGIRVRVTGQGADPAEVRLPSEAAAQASVSATPPKVPVGSPMPQAKNAASSAPSAAPKPAAPKPNQPAGVGLAKDFD